MQSHNFIIDGPDCTGKTTLSNLLSNTYNLPTYHLTYFSDMEAMVKQFDDALDMLRHKQGFILDRYIFSNIAYGNVYHNGNYVMGHFDYLREHDLKKAEIIFSLPKDKQRYLEFFKSKYESREEMYDLERAGDIYDEYAKLYETFKRIKGLRVSRFDIFEYIDNQQRKYYERTKTGWEKTKN